jgi:dolichol-phosphate mannosyltransferase
MNKLSETTIISPTYNEIDNAQILIPALFFHMPGIHLMIVDDSSPDGTGLEVRKMQKHFPNLILLKRPAKLGFGTAYIDAYKKVMKEDRFDYIISMDADFSHDFREIPQMLKLLDSCDFVIGSRYIQGGRIENWNLWRLLLSKFANWYVNYVLKLNIKDITTGFSCFKKETLMKIDIDSIRSQGYSFLVEFKYRVLLEGCKIKEYPILFKERRGGKSKISPKVIWESICMPWKLKFENNLLKTNKNG